MLNLAHDKKSSILTGWWLGSSSVFIHWNPGSGCARCQQKMGERKPSSSKLKHGVYLASFHRLCSQRLVDSQSLTNRDGRDNFQRKHLASFWADVRIIGIWSLRPQLISECWNAEPFPLFNNRIFWAHCKLEMIKTAWFIDKNHMRSWMLEHSTGREWKA